MSFPVGILRPDWLSNATFLGRSTRNGRPVLGWTKADFIDYYADPSTCEPVSCMSKTSWLGLRPAGAPEASFSARARLGLSQAQANQPLGWLWPDRDRETDRSKQKPTPGRQTVPYRACFSTQVSWYFHAMKARFDTVYYANNASVADPAMLLPPAYCNATMGGVSGRQ